VLSHASATGRSLGQPLLKIPVTLRIGLANRISRLRCEARTLDDTYSAYVNRVARQTLPETYQSQVQHLQPSPKFQRQSDGKFSPVSFPGYSVITPPWSDDSENTAFYQGLETLQQQVCDRLPAGLIIALPSESFHMTLADLIWDSAFRHASENPDFESQLRDRIAESFQQSQPQIVGGPPIYWQVLGLVIRPRAIGVCLAPKDEAAYSRILHLRRAIYQNQELIRLGIEQQYHFTAHITLGYFGDVLGERVEISEALSDLTQEWLLEGNSPQSLWVHKAELRKFDDMTRYDRQPDWPELTF